MKVDVARIRISRHVSDDDYRRVALTVCSHARDAADAGLLLDALGIDPATRLPTQKAASA